MDAYDIIYNDITKILNKPNVERDESVISLFDLYNTLNSYFEDLRTLHSNNKFFIHNEPLHIKPYKKLEFHIGKETLQIRICFEEFGFNYFDIINDKGSENIYIETEKSTAKPKRIKTFMKRHYDEIMYMFSILKKYEDFNFGPNYIFEYENYNFCLNISYSGEVNLYIHFIDKFNNINNIEDVFKRNYYGKENLDKLIKSNKFELAKKVSININTQDINILDNSILDVINKSKKKIIKYL